MTRKGKFQLLSYLIDENLIYYKSLNKNKKIVAFAMFETIGISSVISILNQFLKKRLIQYYTVQLNTLDNDKKIILLNFEENKKDSIIKIFNEVERELVENKHPLSFFKNSKLEWKFLEPLLKKSSSKVSLMKSSNSILFLNSTHSFFLNIYSLNLDYLDNFESFIRSFLKITNSFKRNGYLIFNFRIDNNDEITFNPFFAANLAAVVPPVPAPTTITSKDFCIISMAIVLKFNN